MFLLRTPPAAVAPGLPGSCTAVSGLPPFLLLIYLLDFYMHTYLCCVAAGLGRTLFSLGAAVWAHLILFAIQCPAGGLFFEPVGAPTFAGCGHRLRALGTHLLVCFLSQRSWPGS